MALKTLASHYLNCGSSTWVQVNPFEYKPVLGHEATPKNAVSLPAYLIIAHMLGVPHSYLADARYPSKDYTISRSRWFEDLGDVKFTIYPSRGNPNGGLTRFWITCPICGKECACGRFHQHIKVHMPDAWLLNVDVNEKLTEHLYGLKKPIKQRRTDELAMYYPYYYYHRIIISEDIISDEDVTRVYGVDNITRVLHDFTMQGHNIEKCLANVLEKTK